MKQYNSDPAHAVQLRFYGTLPSEQTDTLESPRRALEAVFTYLQSVDAAAAARHREIIKPLLGADADWEGPAAAMTKEIMVADSGRPECAIGSLPRCGAGVWPCAQGPGVRLAVENLAFELQMRARSLWPEAIADPSTTRCMTLPSPEIFSKVTRRWRGENRSTPLSVCVMRWPAIISSTSPRPEGCGKVMVHLHNAHLRRTRTKLPWYEFWPTGAHLDQLFGTRFAVIGGALGTSEENFIARRRRAPSRRGYWRGG